jgi:hypothetical protein
MAAKIEMFIALIVPKKMVEEFFKSSFKRYINEEINVPKIDPKRMI